MMSEHVSIPPLAGATEWLNTEPLDPTDLRGHVVVVNFGTFTCINWLRQLPYVRGWWQAYRNDGLIVVGVHTPEFEFEHDIGEIRRALSDHAVDFPVAIDNDRTIWNAFANRYWPALYFVDHDGVIRDRHFGEGRYERSESVIQQMLGIDRDFARVAGAGAEAAADWERLRSLETYIGYFRTHNFHSSRLELDVPYRYEMPERLEPGHWGLSGTWTIGPESARLDQAGGSIAVQFHARDAHLVLSPGANGPIPIRVLLDGEVPGASHGVDVDEQGNGLLDHGRMYQLIRQHDTIRDRTVEVAFTRPGAEAYAFTFG
jgi:hypothetical protein